MLDGLKGYLALVSGLTEATTAKAREVATALLAQGGVQGVPAGASAMATQIAGLAEDLLVTARENRGMLMEVVREEAERAVASLGVITAAEADALRSRIADLEGELATERARSAGAAASKHPASMSASTELAVRTSRATKPVAKVSGTRAVSPRTTAGAATPITRPDAAQKTAARKTAATKAAATKAAATKTAPRATTRRTEPARRTPATPSATANRAATRRTAATGSAAKKALQARTAPAAGPGTPTSTTASTATPSDTGAGRGE